MLSTVARGRAPGTVLVAALALALTWPTTVDAQAASERVNSLVSAFAAVSERAGAGQWQQADAAFNTALDSLEEHRRPLEVELGEPALAAFARVDGLLADLDAALSAEDAIVVAAVVAYIQAEWLPLAPAGGPGAPPRAPTDTVLAWRQAAGDIGRLLAAGQFRDMRNAAMDLVTAIERQGGAVSRSAGPEGERWVNRARIFAMRLRAAALDAAPEDGVAAARAFDEATTWLLVALGVLPAPPVESTSGGLRIISLDLQGRPGEVLVLPVVAEGIPQVGLGSYRLRVRWAPGALRLLDTSWDIAPGNVVRDEALGVAELSLPAAPTGPSGSAVLARLQFQVSPDPVDPRAYLPGPEWSALELAAAEAGEALRLGDVPRAARTLARAHLAFEAGKDRVGSLYFLLDRAGLAGQLADALLMAVDVTSQPAEADVLAASVAQLAQVLETVPEAYVATLAPRDAVPVTFEVLELTDTNGQALAIAEARSGVVHRVADPLPEPTVVSGPSEPIGATPTPAFGLASPEATSPVEQGTSLRLTSLPPLLFILVAAVGLGLAAVAWVRHQETVAGDEGDRDAGASL